MRETTEVVLKVSGGNGFAAFQVQQMDGVTAGEVFLWLCNKLGPGLIELVGDKPGASLFASLNSEALAYLRKHLLDNSFVKIDGQMSPLTEAQVRTLFRGHSGSLFALLAHALKENYADFFDDIALYLGVDPSKVQALKDKLTASVKGLTRISPETQKPQESGGQHGG